MIEHKCGLNRRLRIPLDPEEQWFVLEYSGSSNSDPHHTHPVPVLDKVSSYLKDDYKACVKANGPGKSQRQIEKSPVTTMMLGGKTPSEHNPALLNSRTKRQIIQTVKKERHPDGLGITGVVAMLEKDKKKLVEERYVQRVVLDNSQAGTMVVTGYKRLIELLHEVPAFEGDATYKRVNEDNFKEWEMVIFHKALSRSVTIMRVYIERETTDTFELMFDEIQRLVLQLTNRTLAFKKLQKDGNILCILSDMCIPQVIGASRSLLKTATHGPTTDDPEVIARHVFKLCHVHIQRGINQLALALKDHPPEALGYIKGCTTHIKTWKDVKNFDKWVSKLGNKQVSGENFLLWIPISKLIYDLRHRLVESEKGS
ncbi:hypothetical protein AAF712_006655 [Marasmius tenuissimus]|uniref:Uncharacterized protein n=1 Tax=Marasmius tenuissimus TaxID=585030 RepID=A0ABR2ZXE9_9AGAR